MFRLFPDPGATPEIHDPATALRAEVRAFLAAERDSGVLRPGRQGWTTWSREFSLKAAAKGYVGMTLPKAYGGHDRAPWERYVVCEEMLAAGAPLGSHWIADRQSAPQILRHGTDRLKNEILPRVVRGEITFGIGMSEPDSGSDLSSIRTKADPVEGGYRLEGRKVWTTNAQHAEYIICLARTAPRSTDRYAGLSQLVVPMKQDGITVRPMRNLAGEEELNEITFDVVFIPADHLLGEGGDGWKLVTEELSFERSGPDRILSSFGVLAMMASMLGQSQDPRGIAELGGLTARMTAVRQLSLQVNARLARGEKVGGLATVMKDYGTGLEQDIPEIARRVLDLMPATDGTTQSATLATAILNAPCFSLRGGTREILKGIIARELGLR